MSLGLWILSTYGLVAVCYFFTYLMTYRIDRESLFEGALISLFWFIPALIFIVHYIKEHRP